MLYPPQNNDTWAFMLSWIIGMQGIQALVQTVKVLSCWKDELFLYLAQFFYFCWGCSNWDSMTTPARPCQVTADSRQGKAPTAHWSSAESLLLAVNTCHLGWLVNQQSSSTRLWGAVRNFGCEEQHWTAWKIQMYYLVWRKPTIPFMVSSEVNSG